jgi:cytochrome P450
MCIGNRFATLEMKAALVHLVRQFEIRVDPSHPFEVRERGLMYPVGGVPVFFTSRD